jgi:DNA-binding response OmpR family regulator
MVHHLTDVTMPGVLERHMPKKILVIDDDPLIRQSVELFLCAEGYEVHEASAGDEALGLLDKFRFDLVLSDVHSPRLKGIDLLSHVRSTSPAVPLIIMTVNYYGNLSATSDRGVVCISKPISFADLRSKIRELIQADVMLG